MAGKFVRGRWTEDGKRNDTFRIDCAALRQPRCRHTSANWSRWEDGEWAFVARISGMPLGENGRFFKGKLVCDTCGHWIHLGPAAPDTPAVVVEREAARLCAEWKPVGGVLTTEGEYRGWAGWPYRQPQNSDEWAGFHAAQIANHDREQAGPGFPGEHLADYDTQGAP